jgi:hypothetical protein
VGVLAVCGATAVASKPQLGDTKMSEICIYCDAEIPEPRAAEVPPVDADEEWEALAADHYEWCEWIATRAHRIAK